MSDIQIPRDLWDDDTEGVIAAWLYDDGDQVASGDTVAEVMVEKAQYEIFAPADGTLRISAAEEATVNKGDVIGTVT